jgi:hypothetical protein
LNISEGLYLIFVPNFVSNPRLQESEETIDGVTVKSFIVVYDEEKDF